LLYADNASFEAHGFSVDERVGELRARPTDDPRECRMRDAHARRRLLLIQPERIGQAKGFHLVECQHHDFQRHRRDSGRFEQYGPRCESNLSATLRARHAGSRLFLL
jgi:hypothetical protein